MRRYGWKWKPLVYLYGRPQPHVGVHAFVEEDEPTLSIALFVEVRIVLNRAWTRRERREQEHRRAEILASEAADWLEEHST